MLIKYNGPAGGGGGGARRAKGKKGGKGALGKRTKRVVRAAPKRTAARQALIEKLRKASRRNKRR